MKDKSVRL